MDDNSMEKTTSSLAIVEKKPQRTGRCVGISSNYLIGTVGFQRISFFPRNCFLQKKNGGDEKQFKHRLIADENSAGFPNMKKNRGSTNVDLERKYETRAPSLVARLMGLESMPVLQRQKSKVIQVSGYESYNPEKFVNNECEHEGGVLNAEKSGSKQELRPQKFQKTSFNERMPMIHLGLRRIHLRMFYRNQKSIIPSSLLRSKVPEIFPRKMHLS